MSFVRLSFLICERIFSFMTYSARYRTVAGSYVRRLLVRVWNTQNTLAVTVRVPDSICKSPACVIFNVISRRQNGPWRARGTRERRVVTAHVYEPQSLLQIYFCHYSKHLHKRIGFLAIFDRFHINSKNIDCLIFFRFPESSAVEPTFLLCQWVHRGFKPSTSSRDFIFSSFSISCLYQKVIFQN